MGAAQMSALREIWKYGVMFINSAANASVIELFYIYDAGNAMIYISS